MQALLDGMLEALQRGPDAESRDRSQESLGLGLFIRREITRAHDGSIEAG